MQFPAGQQAHSDSVPELHAVEPDSAINLEIIGSSGPRPRLRQADFTVIPGDTGREWAEFMGHRLVPIDNIPPFSLLRFRQGVYGDTNRPDGSIITGGLEQEMTRMDAALATHFPVKIHVACATAKPKPLTRISEPGWQGEITVHPVVLKQNAHAANLQVIRTLIAGIDPDVVHIHHPYNKLDLALVHGLPETIGVVASDHGAPRNLNCNPPVVRHRSPLDRIVDRYREHRETRGVLPAMYVTAQQSVRYVNRKIFGTHSSAREAVEAVSARGHGPYHAYNLSAVSEAGKGNLADLPSIVMHPPVDAEFFSPARVSGDVKGSLRRSLEIPEDSQILVYHARICPMKGQAYLPQVVSEIRKLYDQQFKVVLVGPESVWGSVKDLEHEIARLGLQDTFITLSGRPQEYVRDLLGISTLCLFPTFDEGLGLTAVEAQLMKLPVVGHRVGGVPEVVRHGATGSLVTPGDHTGFAHEVCNLLKSPELRTEYGRVGRELMIRDFDPRTLATRAMQSLYLPQLLNTGRFVI